MTSRERVRTVIDGGIPDRIPIDIGGTVVTGIHVDEYIEIARYLNIDCELPKVYDQAQMLARVEGPIRNWLGSDVVGVENASISWGYQNSNWKTWRTQKGNNVLVPNDFNTITLENGTMQLLDAENKVIAQMPKDGLYFDAIEPESKNDFLSEIEFTDPQAFKDSIPLYSDEELRLIQERAEFFHKYTSWSVNGGFIKGNLATSSLFANHPVDQWLCLVLLEPEYTFSLVQAFAEKTLKNIELYLQAVGDDIDTILISCTDFGTQNAELFSPDIFKALYMPNYKIINDYIHKNSSIKTMFHSCGSIRKIIPYFIEAGVDILNPLQTSCAGMDPAELKDAFGDRIVFWGGGIDTQYVYPKGSPEEVAEHVKQRIAILGKNGGFVFSPIHNTQYDVPPRNVETMVQNVMKYGRYDRLL